MLVWGGWGFQGVLSDLEQMGFFQYVVPFLLIFAVVYAILTKIPIFSGDAQGKGGNRGAAILVAVAVGFLALQFNIVPAFFQIIFPSFGIGLSVLLVALILAGAFITDEVAYKWIFFGLGAVIFLFVILSSFSNWQFVGSWWWDYYGSMVIVAIILIAAIVMVVLWGKRGGTP